MDLSILQFINGFHSPEITKIMVLLFDTIMGAKGQLWVYLGIVLLIIPKTRKCGMCVLISYLLSYFLGDLLKDLIARPRPFNVDETLEVLVIKPSSCSCPSLISYLSFASATAIFKYFKAPGTIALIYAAFAAFSRLYFMVHYPTDVVFGAVLGIITALVVFTLIKHERN